MDPQIKEYIDSACQVTVSTLIEKVKELISQQAENQRQWNERIQNTMNEWFNKLEQVGLMNDGSEPNSNHAAEEENNNHTTPITIYSPPEARDDILQGNYPPTPLLNNMIINTGSPVATVHINNESP
ncbi:9176_t:CDS:1, partial [Dentiscutata erythropus]